MQACHWKSQNTFTTFYLKDLTGQDQIEGAFHLGGFVAAQRVMAPPCDQPVKGKKRGGGAPDLSDGACQNPDSIWRTFIPMKLSCQSFFRL